MKFLNKVILIGRVGNLNLKSKTNAAGVTTRILDISLVTPKVTKNKATGEFTEKPIWHSISVFGDATIEYALRFDKGDIVYVYGYIDVVEYGEPPKKIHKIVVDVTGEIKLFEKHVRREQNDEAREENKAFKAPKDDYGRDDSVEF